MALCTVASPMVALEAVIETVASSFAHSAVDDHGSQVTAPVTVWGN